MEHVPDDKVQVAGEGNMTLPVPDVCVNVTVPVGVRGVPLPSLSVTVAVQMVCVFKPTGEGTQLTLVAALRR